MAPRASQIVAMAVIRNPFTSPTSKRARSALPLTDHRTDGPSEIGGGFHQLIRTRSFKLCSGTITPQHAKTAHSDRVRA